MPSVDSEYAILHELQNSSPEKTYHLGQIFRNTTNSYKFLWFLAILSSLKKSDQIEINLKDIFIEMLSLAWHPVCLYRLSMGKQDKLQDAVLEILSKSNLPLDANLETIRETICSDYRKYSFFNFLEKYVPMRFLSPWFSEQLRGKKDHEKNALIKRLAKDSQNSKLPSPYYLNSNSTSIKLNKSWKIFLLENLGIIEGFAEYHFSLFLQTRNPNVPGVINKLHAPSKRNLTIARKYWNFVKKEFIKQDYGHMFMDIYSEKPLCNNFSIDHFLPWSFVAHDLLWNLVPIEKITNSMKSDKLPDLNRYIPHLAKLHYKAIEVSLNGQHFLEDYILCFKKEPQELLSLGEENFIKEYYQIIGPQTQIAINQGFQPNWIYRKPEEK